MKRAVIVGGYGTFGAHVARELAQRGVPLLIVGRDGERAGAFARTLGPEHQGQVLDATSAKSCRAVLAGHSVLVNCAGPFGELDATLLDACLEAGCHYVDITDDRRYAALVRERGPRFAACGLAAIYGCSSLPGISGALALLARAGAKANPARARVTLFIGNNNPKGQAAIQSLLGGLGRPIAAPQGTVYGFRDREVVPLPEPFGPRAVFNFESPEYDLFPELLGVPSVSVKVGFELRMATYAFALLARLGAGGYGPRTARLLKWSSRLFRRFGCSGGAVMTELFFDGGENRRATLLSRRDGQRMAAYPSALAALALTSGGSEWRGSGTVYDLLGWEPMLRQMTAAGFELHK